MIEDIRVYISEEGYRRSDDVLPPVIKPFAFINEDDRICEDIV